MGRPVAHAVFKHGVVAFGSVTGSYSSIVQCTDDAIIVHVFNTLNEPIFLSMDGATDHFKIDCESFTIDLRSSDRQIKTPNVSVKHDGVAPTAGEISVTVIQANE